MKIGLLITSIGNFGQKGFYNAQEIGLAKALDGYFDEVQVYKLIPKNQKEGRELIEGSKNAFLNMIPAKSLGINGFFNMEILDTNLEVLIYFSDTQLIVPKVYKWAKTNGVQFYPYIGVLESHSTDVVKKVLINTLFKRNLAVYKKSHCLVKTPTVEKQLRNMGVQNITVTPVGLDMTLLHQDYKSVDADELKMKYGFKTDDRVVLFIGRLIDEKQPVRMIDIFSELLKKDDNYKLLMVGSGPLKDAVDAAIQKYGVDKNLKQIERIPNSDIWELYCMAECFVNLNQQEIFGMAILEAMYYGCKVVAWKAPGPKLIVEDGVSGYLVDYNQAVVDRVLEAQYCSENGKQRVLEKFTWDNMAQFIYTLVQKIDEKEDY